MDAATAKREYAEARSQALAITDKAMAEDRQLTDDEQTELGTLVKKAKGLHPLIATLVASGSRLLLATAITRARRAGGAHVMCDTDGLFIAATTDGRDIACPGGPERLPDGRPAITTASWPGR